MVEDTKPTATAKSIEELRKDADDAQAILKLAKQQEFQKSLMATPPEVEQTTVTETGSGEQKKRNILTMQRKPSKPINKDSLRPSEAEGFGFFIKNKIIVSIWRISETDELEVARKKIPLTKDTFTYGRGKDKGEYNVILSHHQWRIASKLGNRQMTLNYMLGEPNPISFRLPTVYADAKLGQEIHRRKAYLSLLNKLETIALIMIIMGMVTAAAAIGYAIWKDTDSRTITRENTRLTTENTNLKNQVEEYKGILEQFEIPTAGAPK